MKEIIIRQPDDWHAHLRIGNLMENIINLFNVYGRVVCMGNLAEPLDNLQKIIAYRNSIASLATFLPIIGVVLTKNSTAEEWTKIANLLCGRVFIKYLPQGVTTNSESGIVWPELKNFYPILELAQDRRIPLLIHAEIDKDPKTGVLIPEINREKAAVPYVKESALAFPKLIINIEHVSTSAMLNLIGVHDNLSGSISPNHLIHRYEDVFDNHGNIINVHRYFKPVAKKEHDRKAVVEAALSGSRKFFFGSDSAPHFQADKKNFKRAGAFNALTNLAYLCEFYEMHDAMEKFEPFVSGYGAKRYGLPQNLGKIKLRRQDWQVPFVYNGIVPDLAGRTMKWQVVEIRHEI
jgi:dihydroorotase